MFSQTHRGKNKNARILSWRLELSQLNYDIRHEPGAYKALGPWDRLRLDFKGPVR